MTAICDITAHIDNGAAPPYRHFSNGSTQVYVHLGEARGNPVRFRGCPAAVTGNDRRQKHWPATFGLGSDGQ